MNDNCLATVRIDQDLCSRCLVCFSLCPFQAIERNPEDSHVNIDMQKCQVCGICYSACPASAIEMRYYDYEAMLDHLVNALRKTQAETLVMMCRGNTPSSEEIKEILTEQGLEGKSYIPLRVPCAGRIPTTFVFNALKAGVRNFLSIQCNDEFCRMKEGTRIETRRLLLGKYIISQLGYPEDAIQVVKYSRKAVWDSKECVGCDKCVFICPFGAIKAEPFSSPTIVLDKCLGCGACQMVCPHNAIQVKGYQFDGVLKAYCEAARRAKAQGKSPLLMVFSCQWSEFSALDDPELALKGKNALILEVPCFKGMDPVHVVKALELGFDGVMGVVCAPPDCKLQPGRDVAERQLEVLLNYLKREGLEERFELHELSPRCEGEFANKLDAFYAKIDALCSKTSSDKEDVE